MRKKGKKAARKLAIRQRVWDSEQGQRFARHHTKRPGSLNVRLK